MMPESTVQPRLDDLMNRYLRDRREAQAAGLTGFDADEVLPYEAGPVQPVDAAAAWNEAASVWRTFFGSGALPSLPLGWSALVAGREPVVALSYSLANYPQLLRDFAMVLRPGRLGELRPHAGRPHPGSDLPQWADACLAEGNPARILLAAGVLRLAGLVDRAEALLAAAEIPCATDHRPAWINERAALLWHQGNHTAARDLWASMPGGPARAFNLGMAELFLDDREAARSHLAQAVELLPETSAWHHLAQLYLTLTA